MRIFGRVLMNAADKGGPGAGVPGTTPASLTADDFKLLMGEFTKAIGAEVNKAVHGALAKQRKEQAAAAPPPGTPPPAGDDDDELDDEVVAAGQPPKPATPADAKLARKLKQIERERATEKAERAAEKAAAEAKALDMQRREDRTALAALLAGKVRPELVEAAVALHFDAKKRVARDEDDAEKRVWRDGDDVLSIEEGVTKWLASPEGKAYVPPVDAKGSGNKGGSGAIGADGKRAYSDADIGQLVTGGIPGFNR